MRLEYVGGMLGAGLVAGGAVAAGVLRHAVKGPRSQLLMRSVHRGPADRRELALTFDDGPSPGTPELLQVLAQNPHSGALFAFRGKRGHLVKLLWFDGQGLCLFSKRLDRGRFVWPVTATGTVTLTPTQLSMLLEGIDWRRPERTFTPTLGG